MTDGDDENGALPAGWEHATLGGIGEYLNGRAFKSSEWSTAGRPIIRIQDLTGTNRNPNHFEGEAADRHVVHEGDFLISWSATLGAYIWHGPEAVLNQHIFKVLSKIDQRFHYHLVRNEIADLERRAHGSGMVHVTKGVFEDTKIGLPPRVEQQRIAARLDEVDTRCAAAAAHLRAARAAGARFRRAVLAAASSGRLTSDLRVEDASYDEGNIPGSWRRAILGDLVESVRGGSGEVPTDDITEYPVLRSSSVRPLRIDYDDVRYLSQEQSQKAANFLEDGDLLVTRLNGNIDYVGNAAVVNGLGRRRVQYPDRLFRVRLANPVHAPYLELFFASRAARMQVQAASRSAAGHQRISISDLKGFVLELPPLNEQRQIVRRVKAMLIVADRLTARIDRIGETLARATKASFAKAFRGELVPTEAALAEDEGRPFESADELLVRMNTTVTPTATRRRRRGQQSA